MTFETVVDETIWNPTISQKFVFSFTRPLFVQRWKYVSEQEDLSRIRWSVFFRNQRATSTLTLWMSDAPVLNVSRRLCAIYEHPQCQHDVYSYFIYRAKYPLIIRRAFDVSLSCGVTSTSITYTNESWKYINLIPSSKCKT